ncbi:hypothetical protein ACTXT7_000289 [Hymenolepis weldensis]
MWASNVTFQDAKKANGDGMENGERSGGQKSSACDPHSPHMYGLVLVGGGVVDDFAPAVTDLDYPQRLRECIESQECSKCEQ